MIYQEDGQGYRAVLLALTLPARIAVDFVFMLFRVGIGTYWFFADSYNGINPADRSPTTTGEDK